MKYTLVLLGLCASFLIPCLAAAQMSSQELEQLGQATFQKGFYNKAVTYFQQAVEADPNNAQAYEDLGNAYMKQGDQADALAAYQKSLAINPNNATLKVMVDNLIANAPEAGQSQNQEPSYNQGAEGQAPQETILIHRHRPRYTYSAPVTYADGLPPMDHARVWTRFDFGYNNSNQGDLMGSVSTLNNENAVGSVPLQGVTAVFNSGNAAMAPGGINLGGEIGFLLDTHMGIGIGIRYLQANDYTFNATNSTNTSAGSNYPNDFETTTMTPYVVPFTLDYYLFLPDGGGRFFVSAGVGYYAGTVSVSENYSAVNWATTAGQPNPGQYADNPAGDLTAGNVGFQFGIGRDFAISPNFGISLFGRFRYCKITNFTGTLSDGQPWALAKFSDGSVDIDDPANIGTGGETYATLDWTGFDVGASLNFYSF